MADEANATEEAVESGGGMTKKLIFAGIAVVLLGVGAFVGMTLMGGDEAAEEAVAEDTGADSEPAFYTSLHPPLVVNFKDAGGDSHYMQITMEVMAHEQGIINAVREHTAVIRNALILLYSGAVYEEVTTRAGKEKMLADGLAEIQKVMTDKIGEPGVEAVYFTALVIQ